MSVILVISITFFLIINVTNITMVVGLWCSVSEPVIGEVICGHGGGFATMVRQCHWFVCGKDAVS